MLATLNEWFKSWGKGQNVQRPALLLTRLLLLHGWLRYAMDDSILDKVLVLRLRLRAALSATVARAPLSVRLRKAADAARDVLAAEQRRLIGTGRNSVGGAAIRAGRGRGRGRDGGRGKGESRGRGRDGRGRGRGGRGGKGKKPVADANKPKQVLKKKK